MNINKAKQLERHFKGAANHHRIAIVLFLAKVPDSSLDDITKEMRGNVKTISGHTAKLVYAGLVNKKYHGKTVLHRLSPYGKKFSAFIQTFSYSRE